MSAPKRWIVESTYLAALGAISEILDTQSNRRILVAGRNHRERAQERADNLNAEGAARKLTPCCPPNRQP